MPSVISHLQSLGDFQLISRDWLCPVKQHVHHCLLGIILRADTDLRNWTHRISDAHSKAWSFQEKALQFWSLCSIPIQSNRGHLLNLVHILCHETVWVGKTTYWCIWRVSSYFRCGVLDYFSLVINFIKPLCLNKNKMGFFLIFLLIFGICDKPTTMLATLPVAHFCCQVLLQIILKISSSGRYKRTQGTAICCHIWSYSKH